MRYSDITRDCKYYQSLSKDSKPDSYTHTGHADRASTRPCKENRTDHIAANKAGISVTDYVVRLLQAGRPAVCPSVWLGIPRHGSCSGLARRRVLHHTQIGRASCRERV